MSQNDLVFVNGKRSAGAFYTSKLRAYVAIVSEKKSFVRFARIERRFHVVVFVGMIVTI